MTTERYSKPPDGGTKEFSSARWREASGCKEKLSAKQVSAEGPGRENSQGTGTEADKSGVCRQAEFGLLQYPWCGVAYRSKVPVPGLREMRDSGAGSASKDTLTE